MKQADNWYIEMIFDSAMIKSFSVWRTILLLAITLLMGVVTYAQQYNIKSYSVNDGLPSSNIYDVHLDNLGYLWFASSNGIIRYDGSGYSLFDTRQGLKDPLVYDLHFQQNGEFWVSTEFGGVARFNGENFEYLPELNRLDSVVINFITCRSDEELWLATDQEGVTIWDKVDNQFTVIDESDGLPSNQIWDVFFASDQSIWISTMNGVAKLDEAFNVIETYTFENGLSGQMTYQVIEDLYSNKWIATSNGVTIIKSDGSKEIITELDGTDLMYVFNLSIDEQGVIYVATERRGLFLYDEGNVSRITKANGLASNFLYRLVHGINNAIWVTTDGNGVSLLKDQSFMFYDAETELKANNVFSIKLASDGTFWLGTENGLSSYKNGIFRNYDIPVSLFDDDEIWDIEELPNGNLLLSTYTYQFLEFDGTNFFIPDFYEPINQTLINDIFIDDDGSVWLAAFGELIHFKDGSHHIYEPPNDRYWQLDLMHIFKDSYGNLWLATDGGISRFEDGNFEYFTEADGISGHSVHQITEDSNGNIWLGTNSGISYLKAESLQKNEIVFNPFFDDELHTTETIFLIFDEYGGLWQGTNAGLNYLDVENWYETNELRQIHFSLSKFGNGLEFNGAAKVSDSTGKLWFGTYSKGLVSYTFSNDSGYVASANPPGIYLREVLANEEFIFQQSDENRDDLIRVSSNQNDITVRFNAIDYLDPNKIVVNYILSGYDESWHEGVDLTEVRYTNLPPGEYTFQLRAKSNKSEWSEVYNLISFKVDKPFYSTFPFYLAVGLVLLLIIIVYVNSRIARLEKEQLQKLVDKQTLELTQSLGEKEVLIKEIHHRVKNNLAVISGLLELQGFRLPPGDAKLAIQESKMRIIAMSKIHENLYQNHDLANVDFRKFMSELVKSIQTMMGGENKNIEVIQYIDDIYLTVNIGIPLALIANELVNNCYKHAFDGRDNGTITISFEKNNETYQLVVADDGVGADSNILEKNRKSLGITLVKSLTAQIHGFIEYQNKVGSTFRLTIPVNQNVKKSEIFAE